MTLYRKYRPQTIDELDIASVRETLLSFAQKKELPHAFLFSGPKGTGKTSAARILAKIINCESRDGGEPCNKCEQCLSITDGANIDVFEMDAASSRGIDDIRALRENVSLAPFSAKKKIYIIDEAHMLTNEASNAFLKTLEEPPGHVVFMLATTDAHKLPSTVVSRLTPIYFRKANDEEVVRNLTRVCSGEGFNISSEVLNYIANACDGSFRDAVKHLEYLTMRYGEVDMKSVLEYFSRGSNDELSLFLSLLETKDTKKLLDMVSGFVEKGINIRSFIEDALVLCQKRLVESLNKSGEPGSGFSTSELVYLMELLILARKSEIDGVSTGVSLYILVAKYCVGPGVLGETEVKEVKDSLKKNPEKLKASGQDGKSEAGDGLVDTSSKEVLKAETAQKEEVEVQSLDTGEDVVLPNPVSSPMESNYVDEVLWAKVLGVVREKNITVDALLRACTPLSFSGNELRLGVFYRFHKERLESSVNKNALEEFVSGVVGSPVDISYSLVEKPLSSYSGGNSHEPLIETKDNDIIEAAKDIFG